MPLEIDVKVEEQVLNIGEENPFLSSIDVLDLDDSDGSEHNNYLDTDLGYFTINNLTFPHNLMEVVHRTSNATITIPTRGTSKGSYATRSRYPENLYTITIPLLNDTEEYVNLSADLIEDLKTFGFIEIKSNYLPRVEESYDIYSVDEFRITINSDLDITILEIDIQPVNMAVFGGTPMSYDAGDPSNHVGDFHTVTALDELVRIGDRPTLEERQRKSSEGGSTTLSPLRVSTGKLKKDMTEFRAFLEDSREVRAQKAYNNTNYHEDDIVGDFDLTFKIPYIYPKDGLLADHLVTFEDENSNVNVMDTSEESLIAEGADYRVFEMVDLRSPPLTVTTEEGVEDFEGNSVMDYYQGKPEDVPERARVMKEYIVRYVPDDLAFDGSVHNIKSITYTKSYKFARHYIGNSSIPLTQYVGPKPATLSVVSHYAAPDMNNEYDVSEDVPQFFQRMLRHIDDNNKVYPMANSFNFIKIEDNGLNYIKGKYIPSESYRLASADNSNIEVYATNFIESSMDEVYDSAKFRLATEPVSSNYTRVAAELVAKYLVIANGYFAKKDFSNEKLHSYHSTLLNRLALLRKRVHAESEGRVSVLDGFARTEYIDTEDKVSFGDKVLGLFGLGGDQTPDTSQVNPETGSNE